MRNTPKWTVFWLGFSHANTIITRFLRVPVDAFLIQLSLSLFLSLSLLQLSEVHAVFFSKQHSFVSNHLLHLKHIVPAKNIPGNQCTEIYRRCLVDT